MAKRTSWSNREVNVLIGAIIVAVVIDVAIMNVLRQAGWPWWAADLASVAAGMAASAIAALIGLPWARRRDARR
ncbi:MAG: hypothetical protein J2P30_00060 [Actinobacteria bacterium]|nr:hypothetical protein [Actinomycetota bacterium]